MDFNPESLQEYIPPKSDVKVEATVDVMALQQSCRGSELPVARRHRPTGA